jgi:hypothetical protein
MLALTHHVIVQVAASRCNEVLPFSDYAVLGDDIVINNDTVAIVYRSIMKHLGVDISFNKSLSSNDYCEFAKRFVSPSYGDLSPIGSGLTLQANRDKKFLPCFIAESVRLGYLPFPNTVLAISKKIPRDVLMRCLQVCFGVLGVLSSPSRPISTLSLSSVRSMQGDSDGSARLRSQYYTALKTMKQ